MRAGIAGTPEESEFTSIYERIRELRQRPSAASGVERKTHDELTTPIPLVPFKPDARGDEIAIPYRLEDYLRLLDWTGRAIDPKRASIEKHLPSIIQRLNIDADAWRLAMRPRGNVFGRAIGKLDHLRLHATTLGQSWVRGLRQSRRLYPA